MVQGAEKCDTVKRIMEKFYGEAAMALSILWRQWQLPGSVSVLHLCQAGSVQMDKSA